MKEVNRRTLAEMNLCRLP